jgi:hypothetical protein
VNNKDPKVAEDIKTISNFQAWFYFEKWKIWRCPMDQQALKSGILTWIKRGSWHWYGFNRHRPELSCENIKTMMTVPAQKT